MKANLASLEPKLISFWQELNIYQRLREERKGRDKYILHDGPPYANGLIHIGHAINKILKDIVVKFKILSGYDCPFVVGWDCHGLPVEHQLFKELNLTKHDVKVSDFRKKAKDYALKFVKLQAEDFKRLGVFSDWDNPYLTLDPGYEHAVMKLLEFLVSEGYVYRGRKPVNWCAKCETALAEAEVEYLDKESDSVYVLFKAVEDKGIFSGKEAHFVIWTTTPWTLIANTAVALHPEFSYCLVKHQDKMLVVGSDLLPLLKEKIDLNGQRIKEFKGAELEGIKLSHPFLKREVPVVLADFVSKEEGSGCVHIAPGHGEEDFALTRQYDLEVIMPVNDKGVFEAPPEFKGLDVKKAAAAVLEKLAERNLLVNHRKITHSYPHCWRCKEAIIFRATFQWFLKIDHQDLRARLLKEVEAVRWVPASGKERMRSMLVGRPDWCLSRQRLWGVPIPALRCASCKEVVLAKEVAGRAAAVFKEKGSDSWFNLDVREFIPEGFQCPECAGNKFLKEYDIIDVWFESGASFLGIVKGNPDLAFPADLYLEGSDQHRGWFQVSLIPAVAKEKAAPFKAILTHGFVVDGEGRKMSKSLGNVIAPQEISRQYGAEILRLWAAYSDYSEDVKISNEIIKQLVDMYRKIRNTIRFILGNIADFDIGDNDFQPENLLEVDRFMLAKAGVFYKEVISFYEDFSFYKVCQKVFNFCNLDLSSFYLDILKDRLYTFSPYSKERKSAQFVLYQILNILLKLISPILSFTAEEAFQAWGNLKDKTASVFILGLDGICREEWVDKDLLLKWEWIMALRDAVLPLLEKKREEGSIGSSLEARVFLTCPADDYKRLAGYPDILKEVFIVSAVEVDEGDFEIRVDKARGKKCPRCWNFSEITGKDDKYPDLCHKCLRVLKEGKK